VSRLAELPGIKGGWVFFNNDHRACAPANAATFEAMLSDRA
jgi:hypothetical protein